MVRETIIQRVAKLMNTAGHPNTNIEEAATAAALAAKLVLEHNIEDAELERAGKKGKEEYVRQFVKASNGKQFEHLLAVLADANFCRMLMFKKLKTSALIGQPSNIEITVYMFEVTKREINRLCREAFKRSSLKWNPFWTSFWYGAIDGLAAKLADQRAAERAGTDGGDARALVVVKDADLADALKQMYGTIPDAKRKTVKVDWAAWSRGYEAGNTLSVNPALPADATTAATK